MKLVPHILVLLVFSGVFLHAIRIDTPAPDRVKEYIVVNGSAETGAANLVSAIYLGYRAFDTLGETIVLLVSVAGVIYYIGQINAKN